MNEGTDQPVSIMSSYNSIEASGSGIRTQLVWATLFPLAFFVLLTTLVISTALFRITLNLVLQRNTAQAQVVAYTLLSEGSLTHLNVPSTLMTALQKIHPVEGSVLFVVDSDGHILGNSASDQNMIPVNLTVLMSLIQDWNPASILAESMITNDQTILSFAPIPGENIGVLLTEPWSAVMSPAFYYQLILTGLLILGVVLSLVMLSVGIGRIIQPIANLAENATEAIPGSVFHPIPERGPKEIRTLIMAFNQMVIRLAEQQSLMRQYADKALLSQEEERQRLSHELHDGTLQDLVGLSQRVELCRNELDHSPEIARSRLDELHRLLGQAIEDVRRISNALRPPVLEDFGLSVALDALCKDLSQEKPDLQCEYLISGTHRRLQPDLELAIYRVVQEALANIRKHAQNATLVQLELFYSETEIRVRIKNDGSGFKIQDLPTLVRSGHLGVAGMFERARLIQGNLDIQSDEEGNTVVVLSVPCGNGQAIIE